jgi:uncharacterized protein YjbI with pentapeptide repeats
MPLSDFSSADFDGSTLNGYLSGFQGSDFDLSSFINANLLGIGTSSWGSDSFEYADLQGATLSGIGTSSWQEIDFYHANLEGTTLSGIGTSSWQGIDFQGADLEGATFSGDGLSAFQGLDLQGTVFQGALIDSSTVFGDGENYQDTSFNWAQAGMLLVAPEPSSSWFWFIGLFALIAFSLLHRKSKKL